MKKIIAFILSLVMVFSLFGVNVVAATDDSQITVDEALASGVLMVSLESKSAVAHSDVAVELTIDSNPGFSVMILDLDHSTDSIVLKSVTSASDVSVEFSDNGGSSTIAFYHLGSDYTGTGTLATLTFGVGAFSGVADIALTAEVGNVCNAAALVIEPVLNSGALIVQCSSHAYVFKDRVEASCSSKGAINYECTICGDISTTVIDEAEHSYSSQKVTISVADCDTPGQIAYKCQFCGALKDVEESPALGHKYFDDAEVITKEPDCTNAGSKYRDCYVCNEREIIVIPALEHDDGTWRTTNPGDCTVAGVISRYCNRCDYVLETKVKEQIGHYMGWAVTKAPTCSEEGVEEYMCLICGGEKNGSRAVKKLDHVHGEETVTKAPTCSETGVAQVSCAICNQIVATKDISVVDHVKNTLTVVSAPTDLAAGEGQYKCKECDTVLETVVLPVINAQIYAQSASAVVGKDTQIKVFIADNPGFSVGIIRVRYDETSLIFNGITAGDITDDLTVGTPKAGEIAVLVSLESAEYTENGYVFALNFTLTQNATNGEIELFYDAQNDFAAENGDRVFFNMKSTEITIIDKVIGDVNGDNIVDTTDLAGLKLYLSGSSDQVSPGADCDENGKIDTGDLATLKLMLAGVQ